MLTSCPIFLISNASLKHPNASVPSARLGSHDDLALSSVCQMVITAVVLGLPTAGPLFLRALRAQDM